MELGELCWLLNVLFDSCACRFDKLAITGNYVYFYKRICTVFCPNSFHYLKTLIIVLITASL